MTPGRQTHTGTVQGSPGQTLAPHRPATAPLSTAAPAHKPHPPDTKSWDPIYCPQLLLLSYPHAGKPTSQ